MRLSDKQKEFLCTIFESEKPTDNFPDGIPLYLSHTFMEFRFNTWSERERFYKNLENRGFIVRTGCSKSFARLTDLGKTTVKGIYETN